MLLRLLVGVDGLLDLLRLLLRDRARGSAAGVAHLGTRGSTTGVSDLRAAGSAARIAYLGAARAAARIDLHGTAGSAAGIDDDRAAGSAARIDVDRAAGSATGIDDVRAAGRTGAGIDPMGRRRAARATARISVLRLCVPCEKRRGQRARRQRFLE